ncbi:PQQ-dependent sugar dehydrogenase [Microbacterium sp. NPDC056234]|uniref:PQQ-dependent sugar dehydrogenase n=1 Tax=Microbacterium sp. NPDC056234 TaxID=3345757 RepID=UPI0035DE0DD5
MKIIRRVRQVRVSGVIALLAVMIVAVGCTPAVETRTPATPTHTSAPADGVAATPGPVSIVADGLHVPWSLTFHEDAALVSERESARILEIGGDGALREVGTIADVQPRGEGGLLGIAAHDGHLYVYLTAEQENRIDRYELTGRAGELGLGSAETLVAGIEAGTNHNGGRIAFGPDGMLYVTTGDAGNRSAAQDLDSLSGKILRITPDGAIPDDNPFAGSAVYSYGHRNPQGLTWDEDGLLYASEFGQDTWDELNLIEPGGNYGWPDAEGAADLSGRIDPLAQWAPADASPSGIAIVEDTVFVANLRGERLREVPLSDSAASMDRFVGEYGRLRDVVVAPDGALWVITNNTDGRGDPHTDDDRVIRIPLAGS